MNTAFEKYGTLLSTNVHVMEVTEIEERNRKYI